MFDSKLTFSKHEEYVCKEVFPKMRTLGRVRQFVSRNLAIYMYMSLINPVFMFNNHVYGALCKKDASKLQVMQNNCVCICLQCDRLTPRETLYSATGVPNLEMQRYVSTACIVYQVLNQNSTPFLNGLFEKVTYPSERVTRLVIRENLWVPY